jgi:hypothetical protein
MNTDDFKNEEEFDLYVKGAWDERERIIALIESKDEWHYAFSDVSDVIALIRGEIK